MGLKTFFFLIREIIAQLRTNGDDPVDRDKTNGSEKRERGKLLEKVEAGQQID